MKFSKFFYMAAAAAVALMFAACEQKGGEDGGEPDPPAPTTPAQEGSGETDGYVLVWEDLFDGETLNEEDWNIEVNGDGGGNQELQYYRRENVSIQTDPETNRRCLVLTAQREKELYDGKNFTSGRVNTKNKVAYKQGKFEALIKLPKTKRGLWPAWWAMGNNFDEVGWPACGEFDILEMGNSGGMAFNSDSERYMNGAFHWGPRWDQHMQESYPVTYNYSVQDGEYHLFTWIWDDKSGSCYVDLDKYPDIPPYFTIDISEVNPDDNTVPGNYLQVPYFVILNLAVGGNFPGIYNADGITALNEDNDYKASMWIDYVRIYQKK